METTKISQTAVQNSADLFTSFMESVEQNLYIRCPKCHERVSSNHEEIYTKLYGFCYSCDTAMGEADEEMARYSVEDSTNDGTIGSEVV
jgi:RNA polymerase-binding transcription factor DksA